MTRTFTARFKRQLAYTAAVRHRSLPVRFVHVAHALVVTFEAEAAVGAFIAGPFSMSSRFMMVASGTSAERSAALIARKCSRYMDFRMLA